MLWGSVPKKGTCTRALDQISPVLSCRLQAMPPVLCFLSLNRTLLQKRQGGKVGPATPEERVSIKHQQNVSWENVSWVSHSPLLQIPLSCLFPKKWAGPWSRKRSWNPNLQCQVSLWIYFISMSANIFFTSFVSGIFCSVTWLIVTFNLSIGILQFKKSFYLKISLYNF